MTHFESSDFVKLVDFEEDIDITTVLDGITVNGNQLEVWKEQGLLTRDKGKQDDNAVILGWNIKDSAIAKKMPSYEIKSSSVFWKDSIKSIQLSIGSGDLKWLKSEGVNQKNPESKMDTIMSYDFSLVLTDTLGHSANTKISDVKIIMPPLKTKFTKFDFLDKEMIGDDWEVQMQTFHIPLSKFDKGTSGFDSTAINRIQLIFDQSPKGVVVVDNIGYTTMK